MPTYRLNTFCEVLRKLSSNSDFDFEGEQWVVEWVVWAEIRPLKANERVQGEQVTDVVQERALIRFHEGVIAGMRLRENGRLLEINTVQAVDGGRDYMELGVTECRTIST